MTYEERYAQCIKNGCTPRMADMLAARQAPAAEAGFEPQDVLFSDALGVDPRDREDAICDAKHQGVPTEFTKDGRAVFTSYRHRDQYAKTYGFVSRSDKRGRRVKGRSVKGGLKKGKVPRRKE